jgi:hypothetical protein
MTRRALLCAACSLCTCSTLPVKFALEAWPALYDGKADRQRTRSITGRWCLGSAGCALLLLLLPGQPLIHSRPRRMQSTQQIWPCRTRPLPSFRSAALVLSMQPKWSTLRQKPWADDSSGSHGSTTPYRMPHTAYRIPPDEQTWATGQGSVPQLSRRHVASARALARSVHSPRCAAASKHASLV